MSEQAGENIHNNDKRKMLKKSWQDLNVSGTGEITVSTSL